MSDRDSAYLIIGGYLAGLLLADWRWGWLYLGLVAMVGAIAALRVWALPPWRAWVAAGLLAVAAGPYLHLRTPRPAPADIANQFMPGRLLLSGRVEAVRRTPAGQRFVLVLDAPRFGRVLVRSPASPALVDGERVRVAGTLARPRRAGTPFGFDEAAYLARQQIFVRMQAETLERTAPAPFDWLAWVRSRIVATHQRHLGEEAGALFASLVVGGDAVELPRALQERYRSVGLAHLLAASGTQVSLILAACLALLSRWPRQLQVAMAAAVLALFVLVAGAGPAVLRAGAMGAVVLAAIAIGERADPMAALWLAVCGLLLVNPLWIVDLGFAFSFAATLGLIATTPHLAARLDWLPGPLATALAATLAATLWTLPLQLGAFGQWSPYGLLANLLAAPLVEVLTLGGLVASLFALVAPPLALLADAPLGWVLTLLDALVRRVAALPGSLLTPGLLLPVQVVVLYALLAAAHAGLSIRLSLGLAAATLALPGLLPQPLATVTLLGRSPVVVIEAGRRTLVVDSGSEATVNFQLLPYLEKRGRLALAAVLATSSDPRRNGGLATLFAATDADQWLDGTAPPWPEQWRQTRAQLNAVPLGQGQQLPLGEQVRLRILAAEPASVLLEAGSEKLLLLASADAHRQRALLQVATGFERFWLLGGEKSPLSDWCRLPNLQGILGRAPASCPQLAHPGSPQWQVWPKGVVHSEWGKRRE